MARKQKAKAVPDNTGKALLEEEAMEEASPPPRGQGDGGEDEKFPHYVHPRRVDVEEVVLPKKATTVLLAPWIPENVSLLMDILPKLIKLSFKDFDTR